MPDTIATEPVAQSPDAPLDVEPRRERFNRMMELLNIPARIEHGLVRFIACPVCGGELHWSWRQRDLTHDAFARCLAPGCHWAMWRGDMPDAVRDVYGWEVV